MILINRFTRLSKKQVLLCTLLSIASSLAFAENTESKADSQGWDMVSNENNVTVYTRNVAEHDINEVKAETKLKATVSQLVALFMDVEKCGLWAENCKSAKIMKRKSDNEFTLYRMMENPWPFSNRDYLLQVTLDTSVETGTVLISYEILKGDMAKNECCIRSNIVKGYWKFTPASDGFTEVINQFHEDPAGALPASLLNNVMPSLPVNLLAEISKEISKVH